MMSKRVKYFFWVAIPLSIMVLTLGVLRYGSHQWKWCYVFQTYYWPKKSDHYGMDNPDDFNGSWSTWFENGTLKTKGTYRDGQAHGLIYTYRKSGELMEIANYVDGTMDGLRWLFYKTGELQIVVNNIAVTEKVPTVPPELKGQGIKPVISFSKDGYYCNLIFYYSKKGERVRIAQTLGGDVIYDKDKGIDETITFKRHIDKFELKMKEISKLKNIPINPVILKQ